MYDSQKKDRNLFHQMNFLQRTLLFIFLLAAAGAAAQASIDKDIRYIRNIFNKVNAEKNLEQVGFENEELSDEVPDGGMSLTGFFKKNKILKIEHWAGLSYGTQRVEYYFDRDSLIFVYVMEQHFRLSGDSIDHSKQDLAFEGRYYFRNAALIHQVTKGTGFWNESDDAVSGLLPGSKNYLRFLYSRKNSRD